MNRLQQTPHDQEVQEEEILKKDWWMAFEYLV